MAEKYPNNPIIEQHQTTFNNHSFVALEALLQLGQMQWPISQRNFS